MQTNVKEIPKELEGVLAAQPEIISGAVRFIGSRVPVQALIDTLACGGGIKDFLDGWPDVSPEQAEAVLRWMELHGSTNNSN